MNEARVLVVGDDESLSAALDDAGHAVTAADGGRDAVDAVESGSYDCVLATADAGSRGGFDLARDVAEADALVPTVVVGDEPASAVAEAALQAPVEGYVQAADAAAAPSDLAETVADAAATCRERRDSARVTDDAPVGTCLVRDGTVSRANRAFADHLVQTDDPTGSELVELVAESDRERVAAALRSAEVDAVESVRFSPVEDRHRRFQAHLRRTADDAVLVAAADDTERASRLERLEEDRQMLDSLLGNVPLSIYFKDRQGRHQRVSRYITKTDPDEFIRNDEGKIHTHPDDVIGKTDFDLYAPEFAAETVADDREVMENGEPIVDEIEAGTTILGEDLYTSTTKAPRYDENGDVVGLVGVTVDVTDRIKHRQELERQNERLDEFAEVLTHDLRNPVQIAQGYLEAVRDVHDTENVRACGDALDRIGALIDEIRAFVLEGRTVDDPQPVALEETATAAWSTVQTGEASFEMHGELHLRADAARLRRLLENLFRNAIEHGTPADGDRSEDLTVRVRARDDGFVVADDGVGLPDDPETDVFERGFTTSADGTGFGLAIVDNIAGAHGWDVEAGESAEGGAAFEISDVVRAEGVLGQHLADRS